VHSAQARPPSIDRVLNWTAVAPLLNEYGREPVLAGLRSVLDRVRQAARQGDLFDYTQLAKLAA
jgi:L-seryl-tRNA(Ser) seleniumtransferase